MAELSVDCPVCGKANSLPVDHPDDTFTCVGCGTSSPLDSAAISGTEKVPDYLVGEVVSDCKIIEKVGEGGFGSVYKATDQNLQRIVAFKVMLQSLTTNAEFVQKFIREAVTAAQLNHPNIVAIHKVGRDERRGLHYLIMEFVEGRTLADIVKEKGVLKVEEAVPIMIQACDALATAHEHNIVHRDIKPENLMLDKLGILKITDFGLAKSLSTDHKTTKVMGTPHYMSPEQFEGKNVDGRSDIYSLGVTFYYLLSKGRPYEGQNTVQIIYAILTQQPKSLPDLNKEVPSEVWTIIQKMIAKKAEDRYQTLRETIVDLRRFADKNAGDRSQCPGCGAKNPKGRKFCRGCGAALVVKCPSCAAESPAGAATCSACGADIGRLLRIKKAMEAAARFKSLGDLRRAAESYRQVVELDPTHSEARTELDRLAGTITEVDRVKTEADDLMKTGDLEAALGRVEDLLRRFPMAAEVRQHRDDLKTVLSRRKVDHLLEEADRKLAEGGIREAIELLDQALRADGSRDDVRARRDELARRLAQVAESRQKAAKALAAGRYEEAFALSSEVLKATPGDTAMEDVRRKAQVSVDSVDQFVKRGNDHIAARRLNEALAEFEAALSLRPGDQSLVQLVEKTRGRMAEQRERISLARRHMADRNFADARKILDEVLSEVPDDAEAKSLLAACDRGREELARTKSVEDALREGDRLERAGDFAAALEQFERVVKLDPKNPDAGPRREQVEQKMRGERDIRELANEHLQDGRYADAIGALERLKAVNPVRASQVDAEIADCKKREEKVKADLKRAEDALKKKEYRRALEAASAVLAVAPRHPLASTTRKDAEKQIAAIDRFLSECDRLVLSEMFDEALEALDKAKERGATPEEYKPRKDSCEQGRLTLLKTDATRSLVAKDYEAAIAAYEQVLEVAKSDSDAQKGKKSAERRIRILTTEPMALRLGAAAAVLLLLGVVQFTAVASTKRAEASSTDVANANVEKTNQTAGTETHVRVQLDLTGAWAAEDKLDWAAAKAEYVKWGGIEDYGTRPEVTTGSSFADAMAKAGAVTDRKARIEALRKAARQFLGDIPDRSRARERIVKDAITATWKPWLAEAEKLEAVDENRALRTYADIETVVPEAGSVSSKANYLENVKIGSNHLAEGKFAEAGSSYLKSRDEVLTDDTRRGNVDRRLAELRTKWIAAIVASGAAAGWDGDAYYRDVVGGLSALARTFEPLASDAEAARKSALEDYTKAGGR